LAEVGRLCDAACSCLPTNPIEAAREAGAALIALSPGHRLEYDFPEALPPVLASRSSLTRALVELLRNAAQATSNLAVPIQVGGRATSAGIELWVADHGCGLQAISPERLFEPFQHSTSPAGLGLGLFLVRQLVVCWRGAIHVQSTLDSGSRFALLVPPAEQAARPGGPRAEEPDWTRPHS